MLGVRSENQELGLSEARGSDRTSLGQHTGQAQGGWKLRLYVNSSSSRPARSLDV